MMLFNQNRFKIGFAVAALIGSLNFSACSVEKTREGKMPDVDVSVKEGQLPKYDVDTAKVEVETEEKTIKVPKVEVGTEEKVVTVPDVDVKAPDND